MRLHHVQVACPRGGEDPFTPAAKTHPAFVVDDLEVAAGRIEQAGFAVDWTERTTFEGYQRFHTRDAAGNRVELLSPC